MAQVGHYEKTPVMASWALTSMQTVSYTSSPTRSCTSHNPSLFRNSSSESDALKRRLAVYAGTCADDGPSSIQARTVGRNAGISAKTASMNGIVSAVREAELCRVQHVAVPRIASIHAVCQPVLPQNFS